MTLSQHHKEQTKILVAETIFKGVFTKSKVINHLSDKIAPNELKSVLNELLKDKFVKVSKIKDILEIEESKLNVLKGIIPEKPVLKSKEIEERTERVGRNQYKSNIRKVGYCFRYTKNEGISIIFRLSYSGALYSGTMFCDKELESPELETKLDAFIKAKYQRLQGLQFEFIERQFN